MKHYEVVCAIIYNKDGKIFCTQRGPGRALEGKWEFPGGKVEKHETYEETIVREIKEELNSTILPLEFIGLSNYEYHNLGLYDDFSITLYAYKCQLIEGELSLSEHTDSKWVYKEDLLKMDFAEADKPLLMMLMNL